MICLKMQYNLINKTEASIAYRHFNKLLQDEKVISLEEIKTARTSAQNRARWLYLETISSILNEQGQTFTPIGLKIEVAYTKDNLYTNYWQALRLNMYPEKKNQLNTKEFADLVELAGMMFAKVFQISIPFPSWQDYTRDN